MKVQGRRKREGKTDYRARLKMLVSGRLRLVARLSLRNILLQIIRYEKNGDKILLSAHSNELKGYGWPYSKTNISAAYLLGLLIAAKAKKKGIKEAIFDCGLRNFVGGGVVASILKGAVDGGLKIPHKPEMFPDDSRINGEHIANYSKMLDEEKYKKMFGGYIKLGQKPEDIQKRFLDAKGRILGS